VDEATRKKAQMEEELEALGKVRHRFHLSSASLSHSRTTYLPSLSRLGHTTRESLPIHFPHQRTAVERRDLARLKHKEELLNEYEEQSKAKQWALSDLEQRIASLSQEVSKDSWKGVFGK
jgi:hypothetical protein